MKKQLLTLVMVLALLLTTTACSAAGAVQSLDAAEDNVEARLDAVEDTIESAVRKAVTPAPTAAPAQPVPETTSEPITKEGAEQIALDYLGLTKDQVKRLHTEYEIDGGTGQYDVQFISGDWEYEFEIHAETGRIISYDKDHKYD